MCVQQDAWYEAAHSSISATFEIRFYLWKIRLTCRCAKWEGTMWKHMHVFSKHQKPGNIIHLSINLLNHSTNSGLQWGSGAYFICHRAKRWAPWKGHRGNQIHEHREIILLSVHKLNVICFSLRTHEIFEWQLDRLSGSPSEKGLNLAKFSWYTR